MQMSKWKNDKHCDANVKVEKRQALDANVKEEKKHFKWMVYALQVRSHDERVEAWHGGMSPKKKKNSLS